MDTIPSFSVAVTRFVQLLNADLPIFVTLPGTSMDWSARQFSNALLPMPRIVSGICSVLIHDLPLNADEPTAVTV